MVKKMSTMYVAYPHNIWCRIEKERRLFAIVGMIIRPMDVKVCASPFVAPKDRLLGDANVMYMLPQPDPNSVGQRFLNLRRYAPCPSSITKEADN